MRIDDYNDLYGVYWRQRNLDLSYILLDWQYRAYCGASYFYRPLYWSDGFWHFGIYARYPHRDYFFFGCPNFVFTYTGGHSWHYNGGRSWYYGRVWHGPRDGGPYLGMRHGWDNGRYGGGYVYQSGRRTWAQAGPQYKNRTTNNRAFGNRTFGNMQRGGVNDSPLRTGNRSFGSQPQSQARPRSFGMSTDTNRSFGIPRESSTRSTVNRSSGTVLRSDLSAAVSSATIPLLPVTRSLHSRAHRPAAIPHPRVPHRRAHLSAATALARLAAEAVRAVAPSVEAAAQVVAPSEEDNLNG